jgi:hypothetical protein
MYFQTIINGQFFTAEQLAALHRHGYDLDENGRVRLVDFSNPWASAGRLRNEKSFLSVHTEYDQRDIEAARFVLVWGMPAYGSPMPPEFDFTYTTYDQSTYCRECGSNPNQLKPFSMRRAPRTLSKKAFDLWTSTQLFVTNDLYEDIFYPLGVERMDVLLYKDRTPIKGISQLIIKNKIDVEVGDYDVLDVCDSCQTIRYWSPFFGFYKPIEKNFEIALTNQCLGAGRLTFPGIIISQAVYRNILATKAKGFVFSPCRDEWSPDTRIDVLQPNYPQI